MNDLNFPELFDIIQRMQTDMQTELPASNPYLQQSLIKAIITSCAGRYFENYNQLGAVYNNLFPGTTTGDFLNQWGFLFNITRNNATFAVGDVTVTGVVGTTITENDGLVNSNGDIYFPTEDATIQSVNIQVSLNRIGFVVSATATTPHNFSSNIFVTISGATDIEYNGLFQISVLDQFTFTYTITQVPVGTTDNGFVSANIALFRIVSDGFGQDKNLLPGDSLNFQSIINGVDNNIAYVGYLGVTGGQVEESDDDFRIRVENRFKNPVANYSVSAIENQAFLVTGVTRVWVNPTTPSIGQVTVYFVRDDDEVIIPTQDEIFDVRQSILEIYPADNIQTNLIVLGPIPVLINFNFSSIIPNNQNMKDAIENNLIQYFKTTPGVGDDILENTYNAVIASTIDPISGDQLVSFTLSTPVGDISINSNEIGLLNDVTFI